MTTDDAASSIDLPDAPPDQQSVLAAGGVACWEAPVSIDTYDPGEPDRYPLFLNRRVYQGSSGRVYPMPFIDHISPDKKPRVWRAIHLENEWIRVMLLPELGGRIHIGYDKTAGYDFFYRNNVIKPALVGLSGPWISGGVEFNWPQHHRPATYLPVETALQREADGSVVVWHSDLDPLQRMRGTHGIRLRPGSSVIEAEVRLHNRTDVPQTFLWWANVAARSHDDYQSFFPTDVRFVADHARRAITAFPHADRPYYGVDYPALARAHGGHADRLDVAANIPVPTSYMITDTRDDFMGGYDHRRAAGFVHWADRGIAPGKKQWTWGNGPTGRAWEAQLTDTDGPYIELMAGVFTDNQPDFSHLAPGEVQRFSQYWYPIQQIGPAQRANLDAAISLTLTSGGAARVGVATTGRHPAAVATLSAHGAVLRSWQVSLSPAAPFTAEVELPDPSPLSELRLTVVSEGREIISWQQPSTVEPVEPWVATEPPHPADITSADALYVNGVHLEQNRHPTRSGIGYFREAVRRDPSDSRAATALGAWHHQRGEYAAARRCFETALQRLTSRNLNPISGETSYRLALTLERLGDLPGARDQLEKARWDGHWAHPALLALARLALRRGDPGHALDRLAAAWIRADDPAGRQLRITALRQLGRSDEAQSELAQLRHDDPLDPATLALTGPFAVLDPRTPLTIAADLARAGQFHTALEITASATLSGNPAFGNVEPMRHYLRATWYQSSGDQAAAARELQAARTADPALAFPAGLDDFDALRAAVTADPADVVAHALLGGWLLDAQRLPDAVTHLRRATTLGAVDPVAWRNLAVAEVLTDNVHDAGVGGEDGDSGDTAMSAYEQALSLSGGDPRLVFERDVLWSLRGRSAADRLAAMRQFGDRVLDRDDATIRYIHLLLDLDHVGPALTILRSRRFQPFEGGEGTVIDAFDRAVCAQAEAVVDDDPRAAVQFLTDAIEPPATLGEGRHPASSMARLFAQLGEALAAAGDLDAARAAWERAVTGAGPTAVEPAPVTATDYWRGVAFLRLGAPEAADEVWNALDQRADRLEAGRETPDYFATSLPELLLFDVDTAAARSATAAELRKLAAAGRARAGLVVSV